MNLGLFGTCYLWQKQYFDRLGIDKSTVNEYGKFCQVVMDEIGSWMDSALNIRKLRSVSKYHILIHNFPN